MIKRMALLLAAVFLSAIVTNWLGLFAIFGGFVIGMLLHDQRALVDAWKARAAPVFSIVTRPFHSRPASSKRASAARRVAGSVARASVVQAAVSSRTARRGMPRIIAPSCVRPTSS